MTAADLPTTSGPAPGLGGASRTPDSSRPAHVGEAVSRLRGLIEHRGLAGVVLTGPPAVAWATGGMNTAIDRALPVDMVWVAVSPDRQVIVTTNVEMPRLVDDSAPDSCGFSVVAVPWHDPDAFVAACSAELGVAPAGLGADGLAGFGADVSEDLILRRLALTPFGQAALRSLGRDTTLALERALSSWRPGMTDRDVQAEMVRHLELAGAEAVVALVAGDGRLAGYRHPLALGQPAFERMMAVVVSRRGGLNVAATRFVATAAASDELAERFAGVRHVEASVLEACARGLSYGEATLRLVEAYGEIGHPEAWREHWQGGPIGYGTREFELAPGWEGSPFFSAPVMPGHALAWNPSLSGGAKVEDTFLVGDSGLECVSAPVDWPTEKADGFSEERAAVLVVAGERR